MEIERSLLADLAAVKRDANEGTGGMPSNIIALVVMGVCLGVALLILYFVWYCNGYRWKLYVLRPYEDD